MLLEIKEAWESKTSRLLIEPSLSSRLKKVLPTIIDERQSTFIDGRQLLHSVIVANEVLEEAKRGQKPCLMFKVDFERAYDAVSWDFLSYMMSRMGFCNKWICWIQACLKSASKSVLVNGSPTAEFTPYRGLRQGDPLEPLLFNIVAEGLTGFMRKEVNEKLFSEFLVGKDNIPVSILQYVDDTVFFGEPTMQNVKVIKTILRGFELVSGLKINFAKSYFGAVGKSDQWVREAAGFLNCRILLLPFTYLGIPVGANPKRGQLWDPVIRKCERKLARWKQRHLSFGGRVTLIHSTLFSIPIYCLSFFRLPGKVAEKLIRIQRNFLWGGGSEQRKIPWVNWKIVCLPKERGDLGIKDIWAFNKALLGK